MKDTLKNEILKIIAIITMTVDHIGAVLVPMMIYPRVIGRISLPIFVYLIVQGYQVTKDKEKYYIRLLMWAAVAQVPYSMAFHTMNINVLFTLALCMGAVHSVATKQYLATTWILIMAQIIGASYGMYPIIMSIIYYYLKDSPGKILVLLGLISLQYSFITNEYLQVLSIMGVFLVVGLPEIPGKLRLPRTFYYAYYPIHLMVLSVFILLLQSGQIP